MAGSSKLSLSAQLNVYAQVRQAEAAIKGLAAKPLVINVTTSSKGLRALHDELARVQRKTKEASAGFQDFADKAALAGKRFAAFTVATTGVFALAAAFKKGIKDASDFQVELFKVKQVTGESIRNVGDLGQEVFNVARKFGVSSKEILSVGLTLGQAGRSIKQIKDSLGALSKTRLAATFGDITDTVNALIAAQEQFRISSEDTEQVLGSINTLSAKYAVEAQDLTVAIQKAGGAFASLAQSTDKPKESLNELLALFTAVRSTSRESADTIATGLRTIFARLRRPKTISTLEAFGIDLKDQGGLLKKPLDQIRAISQAVKGLDNRDIRFSQIIEEIGGIRQQAKVIPLLQQIEKAERALITATQGANSLTKDAEIAQRSLANSLAKTREEFLKLINDGFSSDEFQKFAKTLISITDGFIKMGAAIAPIIPAITLLAGARLFRGVGGNPSAFNQISQSISSQFSKKPTKFAKGGIVPGTGNQDNVPALLTPGEMVIDKRTVQKFAGGRKVKGLLTENMLPGTELRQYYDMYKRAKAIYELMSPEQRSKIMAGDSHKYIGKTYKFIKNNVDYGKRFYDILQKRGIIEQAPKYGKSFDFNEHGSYHINKDTIRLSELSDSAPTIDSTNRHEIAHQVYHKGSKNKTDTLNSKLYEFGVRVISTDKIYSRVNELGPGTIRDLIGGSEPLAYSLQHIDSPEKFADAVQGKIPNKVHRRHLRNSLVDSLNTKLPGLNLKIRPPLKYAEGGQVGGSGRGDKVPAMLEPGEFVIPRDAASRFPKGYLEAIRRGEKPRGYSNGGGVGGFDYNPNQVIKSVEEAQQKISQLFKHLNLDVKTFVSNVDKFNTREKRENPGTLAGFIPKDSSIKFKLGTATEADLVHEVGHAIESTLKKAADPATLTRFRKSASAFDPVTHPEIQAADKYNEKTRNKVAGLLEQNKAGTISKKDKSSLTGYYLTEAEIIARGFAENPLGVAANAGIISKGKQKYGNLGIVTTPVVRPQPYSHPLWGNNVVSPPVTPSSTNIVKDYSSPPLPPYNTTNFNAPSTPTPPNKPPRNPPGSRFYQPDGPYGPNPPFLHGFKQSAQRILGKASDKIGGLNESIKNNPVHAAIGSAFLFHMAEEAKQVNTELGHFVKGLATTGTQFVVLSTILNTFGKTAKDAQQLEHDSIKFQEENNKRASAAEAASASGAHLTEAQKAQVRLNKNEGASQRHHNESKRLLEFEKNSILNSAQQKDLERIKKLDANNEILKNTARLAPALTEAAQKERLSNEAAKRKFYYDKRGKPITKEQFEERLASDPNYGTPSYESPRERELLKQRDYALKNKKPSEGVQAQIDTNNAERAALLAKNPGILNKENEIAQAKVRRQQLAQKIAKLQKQKNVDAKQLKESLAAHHEAEKLVAQLNKELLSDEKLEALRINNELQNNRPIKGRLTKDQLARRAKIENFAVAGGAIASAAGSVFSDFGADNLKNNPNSGRGATQSHVGGFLSGAAQGAGVGAVASSFAGPFAPVVLGASVLGGALYGLHASVKKVAEGIRDAKLDTRMRDFSRILEDLKENKGAASLKSTNVLDIVKEFDTEFIKSRGSRDSRDRNENLAGGIEDFLRILASSNISDKEFKNKSDGLIQFVSRFTGTSLKDLDKRFADLAVKARDTAKVFKEVTAAQLREDTRAIATAGLLSTFSDVSTTIEEFDTVLSGGVADLSSVFSRLGQIKDKELFGRANAQASSILGGFGQSGKDFINEGNLINEIGNKLPSILADVFKKGTLEVQGGDHIQEISDRLGGVTQNRPEAQFIKSAILQALGDKIAGGDVGKEIEGGNLKKVVDDVMEHLRKGIGEVSEQAVKLRAQELRLIESTLGKVTELRNQQTELSLSLIDIGERRAIGNAPHGLNSAQFGAFDKSRLQEIAGVGQGTSVAALFNTLQGSRSRLKSTNEDLNAGKGDLLKLEQQRRTEIETISRTEKALRFLGDAASRVAHIDEDIAKEKSIREGKQGILENLAFSDPSQRREITKNLSLFGNAAQNESLKGIPPSLRGGVKSILDQISPDTVVRGKGRNITARELKEKFLKEELGSEGDHIFKETNKEKELKAQREQGLARAEEATKKLREDATRQEKELTSAINTQFPQFLDRLQQLFLENREGDLRLRTQQEENKLGSLGKQRGLAGQLEKELAGTKFKNLNAQDVGELGSLLPLLQNERTSNRNISRLKGFKGVNLFDGNEASRNTGDVETELNQLFRPLQETFGSSAGKIFEDIKIEFDKLSTGTFGGKLDKTNTVDLTFAANKVLAMAKKEELKKEQEKLKTTQGEIGKKGLAGNDLAVLQSNLGAINFLFNKLEGFKDTGSLTALDKQFKDLSTNAGLLNAELKKVVGEKSEVNQAAIKRNVIDFIKSNPLFGLGSLSGFASGGGVPGSGNSDTVPAMLTPGEFVLKKSAVEALGMDTLHQLNNTQHFADGGKVLSPIEQYAISQGQNFKRANAFSRGKIREAFHAEVNAVRKGEQRSGNQQAEKAALYFLGDLEKANEAQAKSDRNNVYRRGLVAKRQADARANRTTVSKSTSLPSSTAPYKRRELGRNGTSPAERRAADRSYQAEVENRKYERRKSDVTTDPRTYSGFSTGIRKPLYRNSGGGTSSSTISNKGTKGFECSISNESMEKFNKAINDFSKPAELLASAIDKMPRTITMEGHHTLDVQVNGIQAFNSMKEEFKNLVMQEIKTTLNKFVDEKMPQVGRVV